ncbi:MAG: TonB-dependent receptor family protein [Saprospiraceae bacterium]
MRILAFILFCFFVNVATAQIDTSNIYDLVPVTVQATRFETEDIKSPLATTSLAKSFIQRGQNQLSVNESLDAIPGLFALNGNNFSQDLLVSIRCFWARAAFGIRGVKVLVDGIPESTPDGQAQVDNLDLGVIENIEVVRGPSSGLYGNASGGVISFTTQNPTANPFVEARVALGSYGLQQYQLKTGQQKGKFGYLLHGIHVNTDGYRENSGMKNTILNGKFNFQLTDKSNLQFLANYANSPQADDPGGINLAQAEEDRRSARDRNLSFMGGEEIVQSRFAFIYKNAIADNQQLEIKTWISNRDFANRLPFGFGGIVEFDRTFTGLNINYELHNDKVFGLPYRAKIGIDLQNQADDRMRFRNEDGVKGGMTLDQKEEFRSFGAFLIQELSFSEKFTAMLGTRFDGVRLKATDNFLSNGDQSGESTLNSFNPTFGLVYSASDAANIYGNISTNFETPTLNELSNNPSGVGGFNPELMPQEATNYEVGIKGIVNNKLRYELALFTINVKEEIVSFELEDFPDQDFFRNAGSTDRKGVEASLTYNLARGLNAFLNYTYSDFKYDSFRSFDGNFLPGIPKHNTFFALNYSRNKGLFGSLQVRSIGELFAKDDNSVTVDGFTVVNLKLGYRHNLTKGHIEPFFGINNLLGTEYFDNVRVNAFGSRFYEPAPTANFYGGVKVFF